MSNLLEKLSEEIGEFAGNVAESHIGWPPLRNWADRAAALEAAPQALKTENEALVDLLGEVDRAPDDPAVRDNVRKVCSYLAALRKAKEEA